MWLLVGKKPEYQLSLRHQVTICIKVAASDGVITGAQFSVPTTISGNSDAATIFGMTPATVTKTIIGRSVNSTGLASTFPMKLMEFLKTFRLQQLGAAQIIPLLIPK